MNRPVGVCITQNSRNPRISSAYKLYTFYYFYIVVLSVSVCRSKKKCPNNKKEIYNYQIVHSTKGHMAVYGLGYHPQNIIWTEAKLRSIYYFVGDRLVHKLPFGPKCHELFVILYSIHANLSDDMFFLLYI
jgi:hypothetical protein